MKLSKESIKYILDLQKNILPIVCCYSNNERVKILNKTIKNYNGRIISLSNINNDIISSNSLLIFIDDLSEEDILSIEKFTITLKKSVAVLLDAKGIDSLIYKRNLVLSFLNKYNINIISGTKEEIDSLIKTKNDYKIEVINNKDNFMYRDFSRKNNVILIIKGDNYYITDGYSEFFIENNSEIFLNKSIMESAYSGMVAVGIGVCKSKCEIIQSILISTMAFFDCCKLALKNYKNNNDYEYTEEVKEKILEEALLNEIKNINVEKIESYGDICYEFKR